MIRQETIRVIRAPEVDASPVEAFEPCTIAHRLELIGIVVAAFVLGGVAALNMPEPVDCGPDRNAATIEQGCGQ